MHVTPTILHTVSRVCLRCLFDTQPVQTPALQLYMFKWLLLHLLQL